MNDTDPLADVIAKRRKPLKQLIAEGDALLRRAEREAMAGIVDTLKKAYGDAGLAAIGPIPDLQYGLELQRHALVKIAADRERDRLRAVARANGQPYPH